MKAHTRETQATMTPEKSLRFLKEGNQRLHTSELQSPYVISYAVFCLKKKK